MNKIVNIPPVQELDSNAAFGAQNLLLAEKLFRRTYGALSNGKGGYISDTVPAFSLMVEYVLKIVNGTCIDGIFFQPGLKSRTGHFDKNDQTDAMFRDGDRLWRILGATLLTLIGYSVEHKIKSRGLTSCVNSYNKIKFNREFHASHPAFDHLRKRFELEDCDPHKLDAELKNASVIQIKSAGDEVGLRAMPQPVEGMGRQLDLFSPKL